jgi:hypothetical protein
MRFDEAFRLPAATLRGPSPPLAPSSSSSFAVATPIPDAPPVINATLCWTRAIGADDLA